MIHGFALGFLKLIKGYGIKGQRALDCRRGVLPKPAQRPCLSAGLGLTGGTLTAHFSSWQGGDVTIKAATRGGGQGWFCPRPSSKWTWPTQSKGCGMKRFKFCLPDIPWACQIPTIPGALSFLEAVLQTEDWETGAVMAGSKHPRLFGFNAFLGL